MQILRLAGPGLFSCIMCLFMESCNTILIARNGTTLDLAAIGLGNLLVNCTALSVALGISGALDTFVSQAHGAQNYPLVAKYFDQCKLVLIIHTGFCAAVFWIADGLLEGFGVDENVAKAASRYTRLCSVGIFPLCMQLAISSLLRNQLQILVPSLISIVSTLFHVFPAYFFISSAGRGVDGAALANLITWSAQFLLLCVFLLHVSPELKQPRLRFFLFERRSLHGLMIYFYICIPAVLMVCGEWWFWELTELVAARLGPSALAANVSMANVMMLTSPITNAVTGAAAALVGRSMGENAPKKAVLYMRAAVLVNLFGWIIVSLAIACFRNRLSEFYSPSDSSVAEKIATCLIILAFFGPVNSTRTVLSGGLRGCGMQNTCFSVTFIVHYAIVLPVSLVLCFHFEFGLKGLWYSFLLGAELGVIALCYVIFRHELKPELPAADIHSARQKNV